MWLVVPAPTQWQTHFILHNQLNLLKCSVFCKGSHSSDSCPTCFSESRPLPKGESYDGHRLILLISELWLAIKENGINLNPWVGKEGGDGHWGGRRLSYSFRRMHALYSVIQPRTLAPPALAYWSWMPKDIISLLLTILGLAVPRCLGLQSLKGGNVGNHFHRFMFYNYYLLLNYYFFIFTMSSISRNNGLKSVFWLLEHQGRS